MANYDLVGNIAIVKFKRDSSSASKKKFARRLLDQYRSVSTVLEKVGRFKGRLRTLQTRWIAGDKTREALYRENGCVFRLNVESCYFSPRLAHERLELASMVRKKEHVLVMFGGVAPFAIVLAKVAKPQEVVSVELGRECNKYALENVKRNKVENIVTIVPGDVRRVVPSLKKKFDRIVMARPNLEDSFLDVAFKVVKKGSIIHYYGFCEEESIGEMTELIMNEAKRARKKIKILKVKKAGDIGVREYRWRADVKIVR